MKKIGYFSLILCFIFIPFLNVNAEEKFNITTGDNINETVDVDGSSIILGNTIDTKNSVKGIDMVLGNNISYNGNSDYSLIFGNSINVKGVTNNDGFIFGNIITFDKEYKNARDLFVFGNSVTIKGEIDRDVNIYASSVILDEVTIKGNVKINASSIELKNATIDKTLSYNEDSNIKISDNAKLSNKETFKVEKETVTDKILNNIVDYVSVLIVFAALALLLPNIFKKIENKLENVSITKFISMLGYGLFFLIIIPIIFILLLTISFGIPLSLLIFTIYMIVILLNIILTGYFIGLIIWKKFIKKDTNILLVGLIGITLIKVLSLIPYVGNIVILISLLLSLSIFSQLFTKDA